MPDLKAHVINMLKSTIETLSNDCTDDEVAEAISSINPHRFGFVRESDFANTDECMRYLGIGNRGKFFSLTKENKIENKRFNNMPIGFRKKDMEKLYYKINGKKKLFK